MAHACLHGLETMLFLHRREEATQATTSIINLGFLLISDSLISNSHGCYSSTFNDHAACILYCFNFHPTSLEPKLNRFDTLYPLALAIRSFSACALSEGRPTIQDDLTGALA